MGFGFLRGVARLIMTETLIDVLETSRGITHKGYTFLDDDLAEKHYSFDALLTEARRRGRQLQSLGLKKGDRLAIIVPEGEDFVLSFLGAVTAGIVPVPMYPPLILGQIDSYIEAARGILEASGARMLLTTKKVSPILWSLTSKVSSLENIALAETLRDTSEKYEEYPDVEVAPG